MLFDQETPPRADFEIVLLDRDRHGNPTGKKRSFSSDNGSEIYDFYVKHEAIMKAIQRKKGKNKTKKGK